MRGVLDPNVLAAALMSRRGTAAELVRLWLGGAFELIASPLLMAQLRRVLAYPKIGAMVGAAEAEAFLALLSEAAEMVDDSAPSPSPRTADPYDNYLITLAKAVRAVIVSGDKHLLGMAGQLPVYSPPDFHRTLNASE